MYIICFDVSCNVISVLKKKIKLNVSSHLIERKIIKKIFSMLNFKNE